MAEPRTLYPGYDVLAKRGGPSWNRQTRAVVDARLALDPQASAPFDAREWRVLGALCARVLPQPADRADPVPLPAMVAAKVAQGRADGYRQPDMPPLAEAWRLGLAALDAEAKARHGLGFPELAPADQDALLARVQTGDVGSDAWGGLPAKRFFATRILHDITSAYYGHPTAWSEIGFGGPASPRGYVRMDFDRRDPWEPVEATPGHEDEARRINQNVR